MNILFVNYGDFTTNSLNHIGAFADQLTRLGHACVVAVPENLASLSVVAHPLFIPVTFELTILLSALCGVLALFFALRLPKLHDPLFAVRGFERVSADRFFLWVGREDARFVPEEGRGPSTRYFLQRLGATTVREVPG